MADLERYTRQEILSQIGKHGQEKLGSARVAVVGAGGLGSPVLTYLASAGVGYIRVIEYDTVCVSNLNRQFLYEEADIGKRKAEAAEKRLKGMNSEVQIEVCQERLEEKNTEKLLENIQIVIDCVDNIHTRLLVNRICLEKNIPLVEGGISGFYGFVTVVDKEHACLKCLGYDETKEQKNIPGLGAAAGVIGSLQAMECLKIILECGSVLYGKLLQYDGLEGSFDEIAVEKREDCQLHHQVEIEKGRK